MSLATIVKRMLIYGSISAVLVAPVSYFAGYSRGAHRVKDAIKTSFEKLAEGNCSFEFGDVKYLIQLKDVSLEKHPEYDSRSELEKLFEK